MPTPTAHTPDPWCGTLTLTLGQRDGQTLPLRQHARAPLKLQRPFYPGEGSCQSVIVHTAGGMVGGDQLDIRIEAAAQTAATITTAAANKVYRSAGATTEQSTQISLSPSACLEWFPQETIVFNGAQFHQMLRVELSPGALWVGWDLTRFGRSARGERFLSGHWQSHTEVWQQDYPLWIDRQHLTGGSDVLDSYHGLAGYAVIGSFTLIGQTVDQATLEQLRQASTQLTDLAAADTGLTPLASGLHCRYRGSSTGAAREWFMRLWQLLKPQLIGRTVYIPRVWGR